MTCLMSEEASATSDDKKDFSESNPLPSTVPKITTSTLRVTLDLQFQRYTLVIFSNITQLTVNIVTEF